MNNVIFRRQWPLLSQQNLMQILNRRKMLIFQNQDLQLIIMQDK